MEKALPGMAVSMISDMEKTLETGSVSWEKDYLPVLNTVMADGALCEKAHASFCRVTGDLERAIYEKFSKQLDANIVFYLGLCNAAGWVTEYRGQSSVLLGIEKIMELNWCGTDDMRGLIYHELGHIYQAQYGVLERDFERSEDAFLWQLFTEGIAMYFEQALVGDFEYFHQDRDGWKGWCAAHLEEIKLDFDHDLKTMTSANQRYFGDWVQYNGHGDVGYYLGCRFVHSVLSSYEFDEALRFDIGTVAQLWKDFVK